MITNGATFSDRNATFIKSQTILEGRGITATPYNPLWRKHRRIANTWLNEKAVDNYTSLLAFEARDMIKTLREDSMDNGPLNPQTYIGRYSLDIMLTITFGFRTDNIHHPIVNKILRLSREFMTTTGPVANLVDFVPILQKFPLSTRSRGRKLHEELIKTYGGLLKDVNSKIKKGEIVKPCLAAGLLSMRNREYLGDQDMVFLTSAFMIGGVETTASIIQWFTALMSTHSDIQRRAQVELDRVVGRDRFPTVEDEADLPYCHAPIKEVKRFRNPCWLGTPHVASEDFTHGDTSIPQGTVIVLNTWTIHHNCDRWADPLEFNPNGYMADNLSSSRWILMVLK